MTLGTALVALVVSGLVAVRAAFGLGYSTAMVDALDDLEDELARGARTPESCMLAVRVANRIGARGWVPWWKRKRTIGGR